jgi:hypothetical protein
VGHLGKTILIFPQLKKKVEPVSQNVKIVVISRRWRRVEKKIVSEYNKGWSKP